MNKTNEKNISDYIDENRKLDAENAKLRAQLAGLELSVAWGHNPFENAPQQAPVVPEGAKWGLGDKVQKVRGSQWRGTVVGFYSTEATPIGYSVESAFEKGSVQVWPEAAIDSWSEAKDGEA